MVDEALVPCRTQDFGDDLHRSWRAHQQAVAGVRPHVTLVLEEQRIQVEAPEAFDRVGGRFDEGLTRSVEGRVEEERCPCEAPEAVD